MDYLIAPALFQNKTCKLPRIGTLTVITSTAETDVGKSLIKAPVPSIVFSAAQEEENIFNEFTALSELIKKDLDEKGRVTLKGVGDFFKNKEGVIDFLPLPLPQRFTPPVVAARIIRQHAEHSMLVGDKETANKVMNEYFVEEGVDEKPPTNRWWIWAIVLGVIGTAILALYILQNGFNLLGNAAGF